MANDTWNKMSQSAINNCFKHGGFIENHKGLPIQIAEHEFDEEDDDEDDDVIFVVTKPKFRFFSSKIMLTSTTIGTKKT